MHTKLFAKLTAIVFCLATVSFAASGCATPDKSHMAGSIMFDVGHEGWVVAHDGKVSEVTLGTVDGDPGARPSAHIFVGSKAPWHDITDTLPQHPEWPPGFG